MFKTFQKTLKLPIIRGMSTENVPFYRYYLPFVFTPKYDFNLDEYEQKVLQHIENAEKYGKPYENGDKKRIVECLTRIEERGDKKMSIYANWPVLDKNNEFDRAPHLILGSMTRCIIGAGIFVSLHPYHLEFIEQLCLAMAGITYVTARNCILAFLIERKPETMHQLEIISEIVKKNNYSENRSMRNNKFKVS